MTPHLWVFNQHYPPDALATAGVLEAWLPHLVARGWAVTVIAGPPALLPSGEAWPPAVPEIRRGVRVLRVAAPIGRDTTAARLRHYAGYAARAALRWAQPAVPDVALTLTTPPVLAGMIGAAGTLLRGVPFVLQVQDLFPDILATSRFAGTPLIGAATAAARFVEQRAAALAPIGEGMARALRERGVPGDRLCVIPNAVDLDDLRPVPRHDNAWRAALALPDDAFVALYAGNVGHVQDMAVLLDTAERLRHAAPRVLLLIVGAGGGRDELAAAIAARGLTNVRLEPFAPRARLAEVMASGDIGLVPLKPGMARYVVPSKAFAYLAAGTPVLAAIEDDADLAVLLRSERVGVVVPPTDPAALTAALVHLSRDATALRDAAARAPALIAERYGGPVVAAAWAALLNRVRRR